MLNKGELLDTLIAIQGIGRNRAIELIKSGVTSVNDLLAPEVYNRLPVETQIYIKYKPIVAPRAIIKDIEQKLSKFRYVFVGSYRRGKPVSRDIDILTRTSIKTAIRNIGSVLDIILYSSGSTKAKLLIKWKNKYYKADVMTATKEQWPFFLMYFTGSKENNIIMRKRAKQLGLLLNQYGLYDRITKRALHANTEEEIYKHLRLKYKIPEDR